MKLLITIISAVVVCVASVSYLGLRSSLARLDGSLVLPGLTAPVSITRDALGVPTVRGRTRADIARATGFLHGQDRFFQMDLMRRVAAGELSGLVGRNALRLDRERRLYRLRAAAQERLDEASPAELEIIEAYAQGVNAGLSDLRAAPFEYILLRARTQAWKPEDTILVNFAMYLQLTDADASRDDAYATLHDRLPVLLREFILNEGTAWDAPLVGNALAAPPPPGPGVCNLRTGATRQYVQSHESRVSFSDPDRLAGSNAWAIAGQRTSTGLAVVANDMHLDLGVPNIWYRMRLIVENQPADEQPLDVTGITLPGAPAVVAGSNGSVAWGFTNSRGDWSDLVILEPDPTNPDAYLTPDGYRPFEVHTETIDVRRAPDEIVNVRSTIWGPVTGTDDRGRLRALHWLALEPEAANLRIMGLETAGNVREAIDIAHTVGAPPQNIMLADSSGDIAWTIMGRIPVRAGFNPQLPSSWAGDDSGWQGWLASEYYPVVINPAIGAVWTANARVVDDPALTLIGKGGYSLGARAKQIRDSLLQLERATIDDMLAIQLDDRSLLHDRWKTLLLGVLNSNPGPLSAARAALRTEIERWDGRADPSTPGYRLIREFRQQIGDELLAGIVSGCGDFTGPINLQRRSQSEGPVWQLVTEQPRHLLPPAYESWRDLFLTAADRSILSCAAEPIEACLWGDINRVEISHPLAGAVPFLSPWLTIHDGLLPGGDHTPRFQQRDHGASERFAVSPGDEENGYFHMPGGQSGHPLSSFYTAGHKAWARGERLPFLPGETVHTLTLTSAD